MDIPPLLLNERYNDRYFDAVDALSEAKRIHIGNARIIERLATAFTVVDTVDTANVTKAEALRTTASSGQKAFRIGETGFGVGRLLLALMDSLDAVAIGIADYIATIEYNTVEKYPIPVERMERILGIFKDRGARTARHIRGLVDAYSCMDYSASGLHSVAISGDGVIINLNLYIGEAMEMVESLDAPCAAWFLDGHAPKKNPDIWRAELMSAIGRKTEIGGTATAFTVAGHVRRALAAAGFSVEKAAGCGGKKEALLGTFRGAVR